MGQILGTVIAAQVTTGNTANTFSIGDTNEMQGGHHSVQTIGDRDAITTERRTEGMTCYVVLTQQVFRLVGGTDNSNWAEIVAADPLARVIAMDALTTAWWGTNGVSQTMAIAVSGTAGANQAYELATQGTNGVNQVYFIANSGTEGVNQLWPIAIAGTAGVNQVFPIAEAGTAGVNQVYPIATAGTAGVNQLWPVVTRGTDMAYLALVTAWAGTVPPPLSTLPEFAAAFAIDEASPMARSEEMRARIW